MADTRRKTGGDRKAFRLKIGRGWGILIYALPMIIVWMGYLLAFWPGSIIPDSAGQWEQAHGDLRLGSWHPILYTFFIKYATIIWDHLASVMILQILGLAFALAYGYHLLAKNSVPKALVWAGVLASALIPLNGFFVTTLVKDILFTIGLTLACAFCINIYFSNGEWLTGKRNLLFFALAIFLTFSRANGIYVGIAILMGLFIFYPPLWRNTARLLTLTIVIFFLYRSVEARIAVRGINNPNVPDFLMWHQLEYYVVENQGLSDEERALFFSMFPEVDGQLVYICNEAEQSYKESYKHGEYAQYILPHFRYLNDRDLPALSGLFFKAMLASPITAVEHIVCRTNILWQVPMPENRNDVRITNDGVQHPGRWVGTPDGSLWPQLEERLLFMLVAARESDVAGNPTWLAPGVYFWLFWAAGLLNLAAVRRPRIFVTALPALAQILVMGIAIYLPKVQYVYPMVPPILLVMPLYLNLGARDMKNLRKQMPKHAAGDRQFGTG